MEYQDKRIEHLQFVLDVAVRSASPGNDACLNCNYKTYCDSAGENRASNSCRHMKSLDGKNIYVLKTVTGSADHIAHTHNSLLPEITRNPDSWVLFVEGARYIHLPTEIEDKETDSRRIKHVKRRYFMSLAYFYEIPIEDALVNLGNPMRRKEISDMTELSLERVNAAILRAIQVRDRRIHCIYDEIFHRDDLPGGYFERLKLFFAADPAYLMHLFDKYPDIEGKNPDFDKVVESWHKISRRTLKERINAHPSRNNILVTTCVCNGPVLDFDD